MLFQVEMTVSLPRDLPAEEAAELKQRERDFSQDLQQKGKWRHLWRIAGKYANISIFDVADAEELHNLLTALPLFPYMTMSVTALCRHASSIHDTDR
jgi:muconolactone D-isomerase